MNKLIAEPLELRHFANFELREHERDLIPICSIDNFLAATANALVIDGKTVAVIGYFQMWEGVIEIFVLPSIHLRKYRFSILKHLKSEIERLLRELPIHRIQTSSWATAETDSWMEYFGFICEGTMFGYTKNKDTYRMWARYKQ